MKLFRCEGGEGLEPGAEASSDTVAVEIQFATQ